MIDSINRIDFERLSTIKDPDFTKLILYFEHHTGLFNVDTLKLELPLSRNKLRYFIRLLSVYEIIHEHEFAQGGRFFQVSAKGFEYLNYIRLEYARAYLIG